jgi:hypothetical protein
MCIDIGNIPYRTASEVNLSRSTPLLPMWRHISRSWAYLRLSVRADTSFPQPRCGLRPCKVSVRCSNTVESQCCHPYKNVMRQSTIVMAGEERQGAVTVVEFREDGWKCSSRSVYLSHVSPFHRQRYPPPKQNRSHITYLYLSYSSGIPAFASCLSLSEGDRWRTANCTFILTPYSQFRPPPHVNAGGFM